MREISEKYCFFSFFSLKARLLIFVLKKSHAQFDDFSTLTYMQLLKIYPSIADALAENQMLL
jgi:hypothetical protein